MRAVIQRVKDAQVQIKGEVYSSISGGILIYLGIAKDDTQKDLLYIAEKSLNLRIFEDKQGKMDLSVLDLNKEVMIVSQFTLYGDLRRGRRPSFNQAASGKEGEKLYNDFIEACKKSGLKIQSGCFGAMMDVIYHNDGPVTILLDSKKAF